MVGVTGAHGYLGSHAVAALLRAGHRVRAVISPWGSPLRLDRLRDGGLLPHVRADITDPASLTGAFDGCDAVIHAAARVADHGPWSAFFDANVHGTRVVCNEAVRAGASRVVLLSSIAVFRYRGFSGEDPRRLPRDADAFAYGRSKRLAEDAVMELAPEAVIVRPALWPYGEGDTSLARVTAAVRRGVFPLVDGGECRLQTVDARFLADVLAHCTVADAAVGRSYLVADEGAPRWRDLILEIAGLLDAPEPRLRLPGAPLETLAAWTEDAWARWAPDMEPPLTRYRAGMMRRDVVLDATAVQRELGLAPTRTRSEALRQALAAPRGAEAAR